MKQYRLMNRYAVIFFQTRSEAVNYRRLHPDFKRRRVVEVLQLCPDKIKYGQQYER